MDLKQKLGNPDEPVTLFEMVPPAASKPGAIDDALAQAAKIQDRVDAINLPEIHDESRGQERTAKFVERIEPRALGSRIRRELGLEVIVNRCVVYDADQVDWLRRTEEEHGIGHVVLVGGESSRIQYPGPTVMQAAKQAASAGLRTTLGGISIPSRLHEPDRVRRKAAAGLAFFTTQVLFDSNDIVWLIQKLNGVEARIFLSFAPVSHPRDLEFLRWLGVDLPADLDRFLLQKNQDGQDGPGSQPIARGDVDTRSVQPGSSPAQLQHPPGEVAEAKSSTASAAAIPRVSSVAHKTIGGSGGKATDAAGPAPGAGATAGATAESAFERSLDLAQRILMDVFDNLPPDPPPIGINIEHINKRNFAAAVQMLDRLNELYAGLISARAR